VRARTPWLCTHELPDAVKFKTQIVPRAFRRIRRVSTWKLQLGSGAFDHALNGRFFGWEVVVERCLVDAGLIRNFWEAQTLEALSGYMIHRDRNQLFAAISGLLLIWGEWPQTRAHNQLR
jgi:hypothetical protein